MRCGVCSMAAKGNTPKKSLKGGIDRNGKDNCRLCCCLLKIKFREFKKTSYISSQLPELSRTMAYTTRNTVNRLTRKQLHLNHVVSERTKGGLNLYIELEKHKLDQIYEKNIRTSLDRRIAFLRLLRRGQI